MEWKEKASEKAGVVGPELTDVNSVFWTLKAGFYRQMGRESIRQKRKEERAGWHKHMADLRQSSSKRWFGAETM